jgi:SNF2 family DNA or RNA helicase
VILDESTAIKTPGSVVSKFFRRKLAPKAEHKLVMTGSAYIKRPLDVWAQVTFATGNEVFAPTYAPFRADYAIPHPMIPGAVLGYRNLEDLAWRLSHVAILMKKSDVLDLPPATHQTRIVRLSPKARKLYDTLKEEQIAEIEALEEEWTAYRKATRDLKGLDEEQLAELDLPDKPQYVTAQHVFTCMRKLMQITSGFIYPDRDEDDPEKDPEPILVGKEKVEEVIKLLELRDSPTVIVCQFNQEEAMLVQAIRKKFGFIPKVLNGSVKKAEDRHKMIAEAANDPAFIVKGSVGSKGVDMRWADMIIFFSHDYDTEDYDQMLARNHRGGQTKPVTYVHLLTENTIDVKIMQSLQRDLKLAASIETSWRALFK